MAIKAHDLAKKLLSGPNHEVWARNPDGAYDLRIESVEGEGDHGSCEDNEHLDGGEDDEPVTKPVVLLELETDDGFFL